MKPPRISPQTLLILRLFLQRPSARRYGYDLSRDSGLKSGTLYPILMRLAKHGLLETEWVISQNGTPPRHTYRLTPKGLQFARAKCSESRAPLRLGARAFSGGRA